MKRVGSMTLVLVMAGGIGVGCAFPTTQVPAGGLFSRVSYPSWYHGVSPAGPGSKRGEAVANAYLGLIATGDASVEAAARSGNIRDIKTVDQEYTLVLGGLFWSWKTIVTGD